MQITQKKPEELLPYPFNNKKHPAKQIAAIVESIKEFGFVQPIVTDKDLVVVIGHGRLEAAKKMGLGSVPVLILTEATDHQTKRLRLLDNRLSDLGEYDLENIKIELEAIGDDDLFELFSDMDLPDMDIVENSSENEDEVPETPIDPIVAKGDVFKLGRHVLMCGDSMDENDVKKLVSMRKGSAKTHCISDPPYGIAYNPEKHGMIMNDDKILDYTGIAKKHTDGFFCMWTGYQVLDVWMRLVKERFGSVTNLIIWHKGGGGMGDCYRTLAQDYEILVVHHRGNEIAGGRGSSTWMWNREEKMEFVKKATKTQMQDVLENISRGIAIWKVGKDSSSEYMHPTQKPVEINRMVLENFTSEGENVLDLFGGSGSNLIACEQAGRNCLMMELDPKYAQVIVRRFMQQYAHEKVECVNRDFPFYELMQ